MRAPLTGITVQIDQHTVPASSTIAAVGCNVLILATAVPSLALTVTSCYLAFSDAAIAVSQLIADAHEERLQQHIIAPTTLQSTLAGTCLLEHAAALRELLERRTQAHVAVPQPPAAMEHAATRSPPTTTPTPTGSSMSSPVAPKCRTPPLRKPARPRGSRSCAATTSSSTTEGYVGWLSSPPTKHGASP